MATKTNRKPTAKPLDRPYVLKGDLVGLKTLRKEDTAIAIKWFQNMETITYLSTRGRPETVESENVFIERVLKNEENELHFAIFDLKKDKYIGGVSLFNMTKNNHATLGICIGDPAYWNRGFGTEAVRLMVEYGFFFLNLWNIRLGYFGYNVRAGKAYAKAGFKEVGRFRGTIMLAGKRYDDIWMDITRDEVDLSRMWGMVPMISEADNKSRSARTAITSAMAEQMD